MSLEPLETSFDFDSHRLAIDGGCFHVMRFFGMVKTESSLLHKEHSTGRGERLHTTAPATRTLRVPIYSIYIYNYTIIHCTRWGLQNATEVMLW